MTTTDVTAVTQQLEVAELVAAAGGERDTVVHLEAVVGAASNAGTVALVDAVADLAPGPAVADLASRLPVVVAAGAGGAA